MKGVLLLPSVGVRSVLGLVFLGWLLSLLGGCAARPPLEEGLPISLIDISDACKIFQGRSRWYQVMDKAYRTWGTPVHVQLAIIHQESKFRSDARPISGGLRLSSAFGYAQALDGTWAQYQKQTGNARADREDFRDAVDFIGWYNTISNKKLHISKWDARSLYLAYHEGHGGYAAKSYRKKSWLMRVADKVERNSVRYRTQLTRCPELLKTDEEPESSTNWFIWPF